jgi:hypothetical protein
LWDHFYSLNSIFVRTIPFILSQGVNIYDVPVYNYPGWMLIMVYATTFILIGRWWFRRSGYSSLVGIVYPLLAAFAALVAMVSPLSQFLLWLAPFGAKGSSAEWVMLVFHLAFPTVLLAVLWRGRMKATIAFRDEWPILLAPLVLHLGDILYPGRRIPWGSVAGGSGQPGPPGAGGLDFPGGKEKTCPPGYAVSPGCDVIRQPSPGIYPSKIGSGPA